MLIAPFTVLRENVFCQGVVDLLNPLRVLLSGGRPFFKSDVLKFSKVDDLQNTGFDRLKITELFGPVRIFEAAGSKAEGNISCRLPISICQMF